MISKLSRFGRRAAAAVAWLVLTTLPGQPVCASSGPFGIDHEWGLDHNGIWSQRYQNALAFAEVATELGGGIYLGKDDPLGQTFWRAADSSALSAAAAEILKLAFSRRRPNQGNNPNQWFQGSCCDSFPSGEVTLQASFVTPYIVEYARDQPWIWSLEALPLYIGIARLKNQAHWQSDVIAGWALGSAIGYWSTQREVPLTVEFLPHGLTIGIRRSF